MIPPLQEGDVVRVVFDCPQFTGAPVLGEEYTVASVRHTGGFGWLLRLDGWAGEWHIAWVEKTS